MDNLAELGSYFNQLMTAKYFCVDFCVYQRNEISVILKIRTKEKKEKRKKGNYLEKKRERERERESFFE